MITANGSDRITALNEAAVQLLTAQPDDASRLASVRALLCAVTSDPAEPDWVRQALGTGIELLDEALGGKLPQDSAIARVNALIELVLQSADTTTADGSPPATVEFTLPPDVARELLPDFIAESSDYLEQLEGALLKLESDPADIEAINVVFRAFHTIKSSASFLGFEPISTLAHRAESLLSHVRDGATFNAVFADLTLHCGDMMRELIAQAPATLDGAVFTLPPTYAPLIQRLAGVDAQLSGTALPAPVAVLAPETQANIPNADTATRASSGAGDSWMRVRTERLDHLVELIGELVVAQSMVAQDPLVERDRHGTLGRKVSHTNKIVRELQNLGMSLRMVPLRPLFQKMQRLARDVAKTAGKRVEFAGSGEETEIDRHMVDFLADPLVHMVRNAVDHGLESPGERTAAGKNPVGTLRLTASHAGGDVIVELQDDGRGLDYNRILASAIAKGVIDRERQLTENDIAHLIFAPGLSTADALTELSGRGVGMDVVRRNIEALGGRIEISSRQGQGTTFTLRLPLTLAITEGMLVRIGSERYIIPTASIHMSFRPAADALTTVAGAGELVTLHGSVMPILRLHEMFGIEDAVTEPTEALLVVISNAGQRYGLLVDELLGQQQFVARPVGDALGAVPGVAGAAILGDGRVGLIIDTAGVIAAL